MGKMGNRYNKYVCSRNELFLCTLEQIEAVIVPFADFRQDLQNNLRKWNF